MRTTIIKTGHVIEIGAQILTAHLDTPRNSTAPRLFELAEMDPVSRKLILLIRATTSLFLETSTENLPRRCLSVAARLFRSRRGFFAIPVTRNFFRVLAFIGFEREPDPSQSCFTPVLAHCQYEKIPIISSRKEPEDGELNLLPPNDVLDDFDAYLAFPIRFEKELYGIIFLCRTVVEQPYTREETSQLVPFVRYAALAFLTAPGLLTISAPWASARSSRKVL